MGSTKSLEPIERYLVGVVFFIPLACLAAGLSAVAIAPDSLFVFAAFICLASPILYGVGGYAANRVAHQPKRRAVPVIAAAVVYCVAIVPWSLERLQFESSACTAQVRLRDG